MQSQWTPGKVATGARRSRKPVERIGLSVPETAEALGISTRYAWKLVKEGALPTFRLGGRTFVPIEGLRQVAFPDNNPREGAA
jgi:excisionase family DNA binding protein